MFPHDKNNSSQTQNINLVYLDYFKSSKSLFAISLLWWTKLGPLLEFVKWTKKPLWRYIVLIWNLLSEEWMGLYNGQPIVLYVAMPAIGWMDHLNAWVEAGFWQCSMYRSSCFLSVSKVFRKCCMRQMLYFHRWFACSCIAVQMWLGDLYFEFK